ncbi:hypothetical protein IGI04_013827 [Brassica rapa subsp. trilocularis]|uniref:Uncharacterized protein n=1 Tax=Brassica rapa subsp. trilocularis TaxID=1813537 RepID=A0ABQ7N9Y4_BRACM|nr:hypothetical protein IGI04_013827 [Brassica rapa subsp. trilocularis]
MQHFSLEFEELTRGLATGLVPFPYDMSTLGLRSRPAWVYFWFPSHKASMLFPQFQDLLTNHYRTSLSTLKGPIPIRRVFWSSCRFLVNLALIPIVGIVKSHVQLYFIRLVRYCPLWALEACPHGFTFGFLHKRPHTIRVGHLFIY